MPKWLDTRGNTKISIAICDRCKMKRAYTELESDPNFPGLRVCCYGCKDQYDPYRLPARQTERINIRFARPDVDIATHPDALTTGEYGEYVLSPEQNTQIPENNENLDSISLSPDTNTDN
jgi:hypothetical protein